MCELFYHTRKGSIINTMLPNKNPQLDEQIARAWRESQERLTKGRAQKTTAAYLDLTKAPIQIDGLKLLSKEDAEKAGTVIFESKGKTLAVASLNPTAPAAAALIKRLEASGYTLRLFTISEQSLEYALSFYAFIPAEGKELSGKIELTKERAETFSKELVSIPFISAALQKALAQRQETGNLLEIIFAGAIIIRASDIHFEPTERGARLRYRLDGMLQTVYEPIPYQIYHRIVSRIKLLAELKINVAEETQDGRFAISLGELEIDFRISVVPATFAETIVMRILDPRSIEIGITDLGFRPDDMKLIQEELQTPNGMILNTGPTGSGKTTTLYTFLRTIATPAKKVITIEDPVEYHLAGIEQTQADEESGYTFATGLEAMMRQDPDVILVGEIRDKDTANTAIQAALTGHLVFSTLHTNSAPGVIPRLVNLGVDVTSLAPAINLIIAQRLVRKLCTKCRVKKEVTPELQKKIDTFLAALPERVLRPEAKDIVLYEPPHTETKTGCALCGFTGYKGRAGVFELMKVDDDIEPIILQNSGEGSVTKFAREHGMVTLQQDAILRVLLGVTTFEEVVNATGPLREFV